MIKKHRASVLFIILLLTGCVLTPASECKALFNQEIQFSDCSTVDSSSIIDLLSNKYKIVAYFKEDECVPCNMSSYNISKLTTTIHTITSRDIPVYFIIGTPNIREVSAISRTYPAIAVLQDADGLFFRKNRLPSRMEHRVLLLDESNRVILIGNPLLDPKIKDLYIRAISEGGMSDSLSVFSDGDTMEHNFGMFPYSESKTTHFALRNDTENIILIDTVFTSCDCTTAIINKMSISPANSALLEVTYKADKPGDFYREVYVKTDKQTFVFSISGTAE